MDSIDLNQDLTKALIVMFEAKGFMIDTVGDTDEFCTLVYEKTLQGFVDRVTDLVGPATDAMTIRIKSVEAQENSMGLHFKIKYFFY